ncbi:MAG: hypothetical protein KatS3mg115_2325 [Candidatus Poribacteria bacterium]|nr:MAG: hypothetical protein KatS3mg115_2325 [Candidatus Poribacteria bacterium]
MTTRRGLLLLSLLLIGWGCQSRPIVWNGTISLTDAELIPLQERLNEQIARGELRWIRTGRNDYVVQLPGSARRYLWTLELRPQTVTIPFGFATAWITQLEFESAELHWDGRERALRLRLDIRDNVGPETGIAADVLAFGQVQRKEFAVTGASFTFWLRPRVDAYGEIVFDPIAFRLRVNTDDAIPEVRQPLRETLELVQAEILRQVNAQFQNYRSELEGWAYAQRPPATHVESLEVREGELIVRLGPGLLFPDLNGDRRVDVQDLSRIALRFGRRSFGEPIAEDLNGDGVVDVRDLVWAARMFGRSR